LRGILACPTSVGQERPVYTLNDIFEIPYPLNVAAFYKRIPVPQIRSSRFAKATQDTVERGYTLNDAVSSPRIKYFPNDPGSD
jgi:hypothetical protein